MSCLSELLVQPYKPEAIAVQDKCLVTYTLPTIDYNPPTVTILESPAMIRDGTDTGRRVWGAARSLATFLANDRGRKYVEGMNVLELGAGLGFLSIVCAKHLGANHALITDMSEVVLMDARKNVALNSVGNAVDIALLQWGYTTLDDIFDKGYEPTEYDIALGSDIVSYDPDALLFFPVC